ncbi:LEAF RUST 10 DISEASE-RESISTANCEUS RECEPTOR-LIKE PROTEIN KINASE-like 2.4 isoform X4 [Aegilops tauschii subsp. strangulata]|uniref:LEAF RUST 10 DISEASE-RESISTANCEUS RECEPTOR-LIKE PROTEIN KINASE-like 2.4 isoform X4 n=1 Tax=Aegilops tauschii subsp. strangulata TaxID=200361 RepID=UPI003CC8D5ED
MGNPGAFHHSITLQSFTVFFLLAVFVADYHVQGGDDGCSLFSCGHLRDISYPFRRRGDPHECGVEEYELGCTSSKATIHINTGTYYVTAINYTGSYFWVMDTNFNTSSSCPLPLWNHIPYFGYYGDTDSVSPPGFRYLLTQSSYEACFCNCSRAVTDNSRYKPVACLSANNSYVYVWVSGSCVVEDLEPYCGYLAKIPFRDEYSSYWRQLQNASYAEITQHISKGFTVQFPVPVYLEPSASEQLRKNINLCLNNSISYFKEQISGTSIINWTHAIFWSEVHFLECVTQDVLCRFLLAPLAVWIGPARYSYTDIVAVTSHFRDKLGQGGYGTVYKGVLLPGDVHVAVKMLEGNSNCNGEDFISEVSTIGRIHHVNVVRLVGFCSEEMRRALVYEYMPNGSLDKYIFSAEKSFSWDKLNEIARGIARGINYLHQGCDMQILHFDIKPHNILLDSNFIPKVADFGLAKLYPRGDSFVPLSAMRGTIGYIAPEMISRSFGVISSKSDVYSFGMLLLEMAGGRRNADPNMGSSSQAYYPSWVYDQLTQEEAGEISPVAANMHELEKKLCVVALWCIQMRSRDRPTMSEVIEILEAGVDGLQMPSRPFFCDEGHNHVEDSYLFSSELTAVSEEELSVVSEEDDV